MEYNRTKERLCGCCQKPKDKQTFHSNPIKVGQMYMCKECCAAKFKDALAATGNEGAALWAVCMANDLPMVREIYEATLEQLKQVPSGAGRKPSLFLTYIALLKDCGKKYRGCIDSDMGLGDFIHIGTEDEIAEAERNEAEIAEQRKVWAKTWGVQYRDGVDYTDEDYEQLDDYFDGYTADIPDMDVGMTLRYRDLCKAELRKFKGDDEKGQTTKEITDLMKLLKISDFANAADKSDSRIAFEKKMAMIETYKPAECEDLQKFVDLCGYEKDRAEDMRCLQNAIAESRNYPDVPRVER